MSTDAKKQANPNTNASHVSELQVQYAAVLILVSSECGSGRASDNMRRIHVVCLWVVTFFKYPDLPGFWSKTAI